MIIYGKKIALGIEQELKEKAQTLPRKSVAFVLFGNDPASLQFIGIKSRVAERIGIETRLFHYANEISTNNALKNIQEIAEQNFHGIVIQLPLPVDMDTEKILNSVPVEKDIDVLSDQAKQSYQDKISNMIPPVAAAVYEILKSINVSMNDKNILIVGNGKLVGEPVGMLLSRENISFSIIDKDTSSIERSEKLLNADIIISGVGIPHMIKPDMIKDGVILIDAGTSESSGKLAGDIDPSCVEKSLFMTPVPGGVGPVTVVKLFVNLGF
jgi:methylenetetrahydrofolate dehydrogenase (NADP+)/methenyltetrahydrofolate cyclohydrolase